MNNKIFILQCRRCNNIIADSTTLINKTNEFYFFKIINNNIKPIKNGTSERFVDVPDPVVEINEIISDNLVCTCKLNIGLYLKAAGKEFNGCSGTYLIPEEFTTKYTIGGTNVLVRTFMDMEEDIEKLKKIVTRIVNNKM